MKYHIVWITTASRTFWKMFDKVYIMTITIVLQMKEVDVCK